MPRSSMREPNWKSKPLHEKKKFVKPIKPQHQVKGLITCPRCGTVEEVVSTNPDGWYTGYCNGEVPTSPGKNETKICDSYITGFVQVAEQDD